MTPGSAVAEATTEGTLVVPVVPVMPVVPVVPGAAGSARLGDEGWGDG